MKNNPKIDNHQRFVARATAPFIKGGPAAVYRQRFMAAKKGFKRQLQAWDEEWRTTSAHHLVGRLSMIALGSSDDYKKQRDDKRSAATKLWLIFVHFASQDLLSYACRLRAADGITSVDPLKALEEHKETLLDRLRPELEPRMRMVSLKAPFNRSEVETDALLCVYEFQSYVSRLNRDVAWQIFKDEAAAQELTEARESKERHRNAGRKSSPKRSELIRDQQIIRQAKQLRADPSVPM